MPEVVKLDGAARMPVRVAIVVQANLGYGSLAAPRAGEHIIAVKNRSSDENPGCRGDQRNRAASGAVPDREEPHRACAGALAAIVALGDEQRAFREAGLARSWTSKPGPWSSSLALASIQLALRRLARNSAVNSTNRRFGYA